MPSNPALSDRTCDDEPAPILVHHPSPRQRRLLCVGIERALLARNRTWPVWSTGHLGPNGAHDYNRLLPQTIGVIGTLTEAVQQSAVTLGLPHVQLHVYGSTANATCTVAFDETTLARLVVAHASARGFRRLAWLGTAGKAAEQTRREAFLAAAQQAGLPCVVSHPWREHLGDALRDWHRARKNLVADLTDLAEPVACLAADDGFARLCLDLLRDSTVSVPTQVAVIGVGDDPAWCDGSPALSSVPLPWITLGQQAGEALLDLIEGQTSTGDMRTVAPLTVQVRTSSDHLATTDLLVLTAIRFMRDHLDAALVVDDVAAAVHSSRRQLFHHFRAALGHTPMHVLTSLRMERAAMLLLQAHAVQTVAALAKQCGYRHRQQFSAAFRRTFGCSVSAFVDHHRPQSLTRRNSR